VISLAALLFIQANLVTVQASPEESCPSGPQVADALALRVPGLLVDALPPQAQPANPTAELAEGLVLRLATGDATLTVELVDRAGQVRLVRRLPQSQNVTPASCATLADTVALVALRFLTDLGVVVGDLPAQPASPTTHPKPLANEPKVQLEETLKSAGEPRPKTAPSRPSLRRIELDLAFGAQTGRPALEVALSARHLFTGIAPWLAEMRLTANNPESLEWQNADQSEGSATLSSYGLEAALGKRWVGADARQAWDLAGWGAVRWLRVREGGEAERLQNAAAGAAGGQVAWSVAVAERLFVRVTARVGMNLSRHVLEGPDGAIYDTARLRGTINVGLGARF